MKFQFPSRPAFSGRAGLVAALALAAAGVCFRSATACVDPPASDPVLVLEFLDPTTISIRALDYTSQAVTTSQFCVTAFSVVAPITSVDSSELYDVGSGSTILTLAPNANTSAGFSAIAGQTMQGFWASVGTAIPAGLSVEVRFTATVAPGTTEQQLIDALTASAIVIGTDEGIADGSPSGFSFSILPAGLVTFEQGGQCTEPDVNCQRPDQLGHGAAGTVGATSDANTAAGFAVADNFTPAVTGSVSGLCFWGFYIDFGVPADCGPGTGDSFRATYFLDDGGVPGPVIAVRNLGATLTKGISGTIPTGIGDVVEYEYTATHNPVPVNAGTCYWVQIQNFTAGNCFWLWETAPPGDFISVQRTGALPYTSADLNDYDLAFCLDVELGDTSTCTPGGCCFTDGSCQDLFEPDCLTMDGQFHPSTNCQTGGVICNPDNTCTWDNGAGDPNAGAPSSQFAPGEFWSETADNFILKGPGPNGCEISGVRTWITHFNQDAGGCAMNPGCTDSPDDYSAIWVVIYNNEDPIAKGPTGEPEHVDDGSGNLVPTGEHIGLVKEIHRVLPANFSWVPYMVDGSPVPDAYEIDIDLSGLGIVLEKNKKNWLAISPEVPFTNFFQTGWMESTNFDGNPAQQIFAALGSLTWGPIGNDDVSFLLMGTKEGGGTPCPADLSGNDDVDFADILIVIGNWGPCDPPCPPSCAADLSGNCDVDFADILAIIGAWGPCAP